MADMDSNKELIAQNINDETEQLKTTTATVKKTEFSVDQSKLSTMKSNSAILSKISTQKGRRANVPLSSMLSSIK